MYAGLLNIVGYGHIPYSYLSMEEKAECRLLRWSFLKSISYGLMCRRRTLFVLEVLNLLSASSEEADRINPEEIDLCRKTFNDKNDRVEHYKFSFFIDIFLHWVYAKHHMCYIDNLLSRARTPLHLIGHSP